jgi:hypothetical protein
MWRPMNAATLSSVESAGRVEGAGARADRVPVWDVKPGGLSGRPPEYSTESPAGNRATRIGVWHRLPSTALIQRRSRTARKEVGLS